MMRHLRRGNLDPEPRLPSPPRAAWASKSFRLFGGFPAQVLLPRGTPLSGSARAAPGTLLSPLTLVCVDP